MKGDKDERNGGTMYVRWRHHQCPSTAQLTLIIQTFNYPETILHIKNCICTCDIILFLNPHVLASYTEPASGCVLEMVKEVYFLHKS